MKKCFKKNVQLGCLDKANELVNLNSRINLINRPYIFFVAHLQINCFEKNYIIQIKELRRLINSIYDEIQVSNHVEIKMHLLRDMKNIYEVSKEIVEFFGNDEKAVLELEKMVNEFRQNRETIRQQIINHKEVV